MATEHYDIVVIGTGPGGEGAAMQSIKQGKSVAVVERAMQIGGNCTHRGTIPSKALRTSIHQLTVARNNPVLKEMGVTMNVPFHKLRKSAAAVIARQVNMREGFYTRNNVDIIQGHARFVDAHCIEVQEQSGASRVVKADAFIIATGSRPHCPDEIDFDHPHIFCSDSILNLQETPRSITVYGAGVIGCEYASMFRNLNVKVNLVNTRDKLLEFLDDEIIDALSYHLRDSGMLIRHRESLEKVEGCDDGVILHLKSGKQLKTDIILYAAGRSGNSNNMNFEAIGIKPTSRGHLQINEDFQTDIPHIYAVGDIIGFPALASAAYVQGRYAAGHLINGEFDRSMISEIPTGIFTSPEISSVGKNERELTEANIPYEVGHSMFKHLARAQITGQTTGMLKLLFHRETLEILGVHCFGANASEIIHIGQAIMMQQGQANTINYFVNTTFNYPTMAEAYRVAALNGMNRLF